MSTTIIPPSPPSQAPPDPAQAGPSKPRAAQAQGDTLAGAIVPGAALTALISLAWLSHQFGLKVLLAALIALALTGAGAAVAIGRTVAGRRSRRAAASTFGRGQGRGGLGRFFGRQAAPLGQGRTASIPAAARRPAAMGAAGGAGRPQGASSARTGSTGPAGRQTAPDARLAARQAPFGLPAPQRPLPRTTGPQGAVGTGSRTSGALNNRPGAHHRGGTAAGAVIGAGAGALLGRRAAAHTKPTTPGTPAPAGRGRHGKNTPGKPTSPGKPGLLKGRQARKAAKAQAQAAGLGTGAKGKGLNKSGQPIKPKPGPLPVKPAGKLRRGGQWLKKKTGPQLTALKATAAKHTVGKLKNPATAAKAKRATAKLLKKSRKGASWLSKGAAHLVKHGSRWTMAAHLGLKRARLGGAGPNWWPQLAKVLSWCTTPAAWLVSRSYGWSWLQTWVFVRTGGAKTPIPVNTGIGRTPRTAAGHAPTASSAVRRATIPLMRGARMSSDAAPLHQAADTIRTAFATVAVNPAENMVGFEAVVTSIPELFDALTDGLNTLSTVFEEAFKVNEAIPDAYRDAATYTKGLSDHVQAIHQMYRALHEEQIENIENPTEQAAKWDVDRNRQA